MVTRVVKMVFRPDTVTEFRQLFEQRQNKIAAFDGCRSLQLLQCVDDSRVFFTVSVWERTEQLEAYRSSEFFDETWRTVKQLFADRPEAWTLQ